MNLLKPFSRIASILLLGGFLVADVYADPNNNKTGEDLPTPAALYAKHVQAMGGKQRIQAKTSRTLKGSLDIAAMGVSGELEVVTSAPDKMLTQVKIPKFNSTTREGYNGNVAWKVDPMAGNKVLSGDELDAIKRQADFYADTLNLGKGSSRQETLGLLDVDGDAQYKVMLVNNKGDESFLYFSKETGLLSGKESMEATAYGKLPTRVKIKNYADYEGLKAATHLIVLQGGVETVVKFDSISFASVAENTFDTPKEIQALIK